jgi:spore germination protein GerM
MATLYFVRHGRLVPIREHIPFGPNVPEQATRQLLAGPTSRDIRVGDTTAIPSQTRLISLDLRGSVAVVDLSKEFAGTGGVDQALAVGQIVLTLTAAPEVRSVQFAIEGDQIEAPDGRGSLSSQPRSAADFRVMTAPQ